MEAEKFLQQVEKNKNIPPLLLVLGDEDYYVDKVVAAVKNVWCAGAGEDCVTVLEEDPSPAQLRDLVDSAPFFSERTLLLVRHSKLLTAGKGGDAGKDKEVYGKILAQIPEHCRVIWHSGKADKRIKLFKTLAALGETVECEKIKAWKVKDWLAQAAKEKGCRWEAAALEMVAGYAALAESISLYFLAQEVEKISLYAGERKVWTAEDVKNIFSSFAEVSGFALAEAMTAGDAAKALSILREQTARGVYILQFLGLIERQMQRMWRAKSIIEKGGGKEEVAAQLKMPAFFAGDFTRRCQKLPEKRLKDAFKGLAEISREVRLGGRGVERLEEVIIEFCR